jgi:hypothetical protein
LQYSRRRSYVVSSEQMKEIKGKSVDSNKLTKVYGTMPTQEEIKKIARERGLITYQRRNPNWDTKASTVRQVPQRPNSKQSETDGAIKRFPFRKAISKYGF